MSGPQDSGMRTHNRLVAARKILDLRKRADDRRKNRRGMRLLLVNCTSSRADFTTIEGSMAILQEAWDPDGAWRPIEDMPALCGVGLYSVHLDPNEYWSFAVPRYQGNFRTRLRFRFERGDGEMILSNEFEGNVFKEQFNARQEVR